MVYRPEDKDKRSCWFAWVILWTMVLVWIALLFVAFGDGEAWLG